MQLTSIRNVFTLLSSITVFVVGRSLFLENPDDSELELDISRQEFKFQKFHHYEKLRVCHHFSEFEKINDPPPFFTNFSNSQICNFGTLESNLTDGLKPNCSWDKPPADQVSWSDRHVFKKLSLGAVALGFLFQGLIFHFFVPEKNACAEMENGDIEENQENQEECCENTDLSRSQILGKVSLRSSALAVDTAGMEKPDESPMVVLSPLFPT